MKNAMLWKRILHEGVSHRPNPNFADDEQLAEMERQFAKIAERSIIRCPIIVSHIKPDEDAAEPLNGRWPISLPFNDFWLEGQCARGGLWGARVTANPQENREGDGWYGFIESYYAADGVAPHHTAGHSFAVDATGNVFWEPPSGAIDNDNRRRGIAAFVGAFETLAMLACSNVSLAPRLQRDAATVRAATKRNGGHAAGYRYHVLVVRPAGARSDAPAQEIGNMPRHVCRGHFAEYGPEFGKGLLFGRLAGRFYIPPHVRGDAKNGVVEKDYEVRP